MNDFLKRETPVLVPLGVLAAGAIVWLLWLTNRVTDNQRTLAYMEAQNGEVLKRLDRIEDKLDRLQEAKQ